MSTLPSGLYDAHSNDDPPPAKRTVDQRIEELERERLRLHEELKKLAEKIGDINAQLNGLRGTRRPDR